MSFLKNMKKAVFYFFVLCLVFGAFACRKQPAAQNLPATFIWDKDQQSIDPRFGTMNVWEGFQVKDNSFLADNKISRFILWRTKESTATATIDYILEGQPVRFKLNGEKAGELPPSADIHSARFNIKLNSGFNFLEFIKPKISVLKIMSINVGERSGRPVDHLKKGETLAIYNEKGSGVIEFRGKGRLRITEAVFSDGQKTTRTSVHRAKFWPRAIKHVFTNTSLGLLKATVESGSFNIVGYSFAPAIAESGPTKSINLPGNINVFIFLLDGCQARHLGVYGYPRPTSPNIDRFAEDAVVFENAYANASFTRSSVATLFTGMFPDRHKVRIMQNKLPEQLLTIPAFLKAKGYRTSLFTATANISQSFGFTRGVDNYFPYIGHWNKGGEKLIPSEFRKWLSTDGPLFSYVHFMEPHLPISPPLPYLHKFMDPKAVPFSRTVMSNLHKNAKDGHVFTAEEVKAVIDTYDSTIAYIDGELEKLLAALREKGLYKESLILIVSDHGESMYEEGHWGHGHIVFEDTTHVPLLVKFPASLNLKGRVKTVVQLTDVFPTLVDLFGQKIKADGKSLFAALSVNALDDAFAISRTFSIVGDYGFRWREWYGIINLDTGRERYFREAHSAFLKVEAPSPDIRLLLKARFLNWLNQFSENDKEAAQIDVEGLPKNELENLKSLGYLK